MNRRGQESSSRKLVWVEGQGDNGSEGCSECAWVFIPPSSPVSGLLSEWVLNVDVQLSEQFGAHDCAEYPKAKVAKAGWSPTLVGALFVCIAGAHSSKRISYVASRKFGSVLLKPSGTLLLCAGYHSSVKHGKQMSAPFFGN
jgi:hypothetical protein